jgi:hypothetical protein
MNVTDAYALFGKIPTSVIEVVPTLEALLVVIVKVRVLGL